MKLSRVWLVVLSLVTPLLQSGQATAQVSIMPVGDSITQGIGGKCSYRRALSQALIKNGCAVDFVGSRITAGNGGTANSPATPLCAPQNTDHQGVSGFRADQILNNSEYDFAAELEARQPDIVLLHVGSNDLFQNQSAQNSAVAATVNDVDDIIDSVLLERPDATVVVADVIPWAEGTFSNPNRDMLADTAQLSAALKTLVDNRADGSVVLVEVKDGFNNDLMAFDGVHPNPVGEAHISNQMLNALYDLDVCNGEPAMDVQPPITYISTPSTEAEELPMSSALSGTALDEGGSGFEKVRIAIQNSDELWWNQTTGNFGDFDGSVVATMSAQETGSTSWSITPNLAPGDYQLFALALDTQGNQVDETITTAAGIVLEKVWTKRAFSVVDDTVPAPTPPAITSPVVGATLAAGSTTFSWDTNDVAVTEWWLYAGNAEEGEGQRLYDRGQGLPAGTTSSVVTGLPSDGSNVFITLWYKPENSGWKSVITQYRASSTNNGGGPAISSPAVGSTLSSAAETFTWAPNGATVDEYWLYVGAGVNQFEYYNSRLLTGSNAYVSSLPTNGETVYVRLWHRETDGEWLFVDSTYTAANVAWPGIASPVNGSTISTSQTFNWNANGVNADEWWLYAGTSPGTADLYNSGTLGSATSGTINVDPMADLQSGDAVYVTLWHRATGAAWFPVRYKYSVE